MATQTKKTNIAILPSPGMGHLIPLVELAKRLVVHPNVSVTFIIPNDGSPSKAQKAVLDSLADTISYVFLPPVSFDDFPHDTKVETLIILTVSRSLPALREFFKEHSEFSSLVVDLFATDAFDVAKEFDIPPYIFFPTTAMCLSFVFYLPKLDETVSCEYRELKDLVQIPGCIPVRGKDLLDPVQDRKNDAYKHVLCQFKRYPLAEGIMVNSFKELEDGAITFLQKNHKTGNNLPIYPVGPLVNVGGSSQNGSECVKWLDEQPQGSVLYVSFGSGGTLSFEQVCELALGLEMSGQRFLWVVRSPNNVANSTFFSVQSQNNPFDFLPKGFLERTKGKGLLVPSWAPQAQVLSHGSTGGFLTHCGWNSTLESVVNGVPLIAWPLYAEQKMNAVMLSEDVKIALRPTVNNENGLIGREEIANVVRSLMEGQEGKRVRQKMKDLKEAASRTLSEDGSSTKALTELLHKWKK